MISAQIIESFQITGRGTVVVIDAKTKLPVGRCLQATIIQHDGATQDFEAWKEWLLRRSEPPQEDEAFRIPNATIGQIPVGGSITLQIKDA